ncbi:MAG: hypothetical protein QG635_1672 [Bacteroidota bacterium]|nr:hypothetical protein [Bacteroidota bacterium]
MKNTITYTNTITVDLMNLLNDYSKKLKVPKSKIIEQSLSHYFLELKKKEYADSFKKAKNDKEINDLAEEGLEEYLEIIDYKIYHFFSDNFSYNH